MTFFLFFFCFLFTLSLAFWLGFSDPFVSQSPREFYTSRFFWERFCIVYISFACYGQTLIPCIIPSGLLFLPSRAKSCMVYVSFLHKNWCANWFGILVFVVRISRDQSRSCHGNYLSWLVVSWYLQSCHVAHCIIPSVIWVFNGI